MKEDLYVPEGHVFYFEPNDLSFGHTEEDPFNTGSVPLMSHIEDMCIAVSLVADSYPRTKNSINDRVLHNATPEERKTMSWITYATGGKDGQRAQHRQIVNGGVELGEENYLTTYYTEISADRYIEKEIVEGLGVTSIDIAFESWYTPTITINFVDVHGSALWGREEAIHDNGEITSDNLLGVFFTQPYPIFRLQVKGFLGHDVTYQLAVSSFKGRYNSQTGNFEATATFIGYSYSLLSDVPLKMLAYIGDMDYVGKEYWEENAYNTNPRWKLLSTKGDPIDPPKLYKFIEAIKNAVAAPNSQRVLDCDNNATNVTTIVSGGDATATEQVISNDLSSAINAGTSGAQDIKTVVNAFNSFYDLIKKRVSKCGGGQVFKTNSYDKKNQQIVVICNKLWYRSVDVKETYLHFCETLDAYNTKYPGSKIVNGIAGSSTHIHKSLSTVNHNTFVAYDVATYTTQTGASIVVTPVANPNTQVKNQSEKFYNTSIEAIKKYCKQITDGQKVSYPAPEKTEVIHKFKAYVIPLGKMCGVLDSEYKRITKSSAGAIANVEDAIVGSTGNDEVAPPSQGQSAEDKDKELQEELRKAVAEITGFEPTIGNFTKMMMCHLETFVHVMMTAGQEIYEDMLAGERSPEKLGLDLDETDIARGKTNSEGTNGNNEDIIWPWPGLYPSKQPENKETKLPTNSQFESLGWPEDYNNGRGWKENIVVRSFMDAVKKYFEELQSGAMSLKMEYDYIPINGSDIFSLKSPFSEVANDCNTLENLATYLGLRMAKIIGVGDNTCTKDEAEAIGSVDAINMISKRHKMSEIIKSMESNGNFKNSVEAAINYITCSNKGVQSNGTENGEKYNIFETEFKEGNNPYTNQSRHPMYLRSSDKGYKYTYFPTYNNSGDKLISIVPSVIHRFNRNMPYVSSIIPVPAEGNKKKHFVPNLNVNEFLYTAKTTSFVLEDKAKEYINDNEFFVISDITISSSLEKRIESLKNGELKYKDYTIEKDDNLVKKFLDRKYKLGSFVHNYNASGMLMRKMSTIETDDVKKYLEKNICSSEDKKTSIEYNSDWITPKKKIYDAIELKISGDKIISTVKENEECNVGDIMVRDLPVKINETTYSLFGTKLYYQQNEITNDEQCIKAKSYLLLSSMMRGIKLDSQNFFKKDGSFISTIQPCYVYFIGAILWRRKYMDEHDGADPINFQGYGSVDKDTTFITTNNEFHVGSGVKNRRYKISDYYMNYSDIDAAVKNKLIKMFEYFAFNELKPFVQNCELIPTDSEKKWVNIAEEWQKTDFNAKSPDAWSKLFTNIFGKYASIVQTATKDGLRLLFDEGNPINLTIMNLMGLNGGYVIGRATTKKVGHGNNEVYITSEQMHGYLNGFFNRLRDAGKETEKKQKVEDVPLNPVIDRDIAISMYYSLKHIWDTWLITAGRYDFTIENFFNKYFVFMDSFYVNTYNLIKLNLQFVLDAYNSKETNLLTFITDITSKVGCMFLSLPTFIDGNNLDGGGSNVRAYDEKHPDGVWNLDNLRKMFTPMPYNDMGRIKPNNVFVFIYTHPFSDNALENTDKKFDGYLMDKRVLRPPVLELKAVPHDGDLESREVGDAYQKMRPNNTIPQGDEELVSGRYAYLMPCFGVTVNRGNNYIFKSINVNMDSPKITAVSAQTLEDIYTKAGSDGSRRVFFHGQDIYSIYSQYSYACEIEMMGCAQIQPLMYFQLLNIPMWRGTYMIYKVRHSLTPGNMVTKFTGMKMSRRSAPFATEYFSMGNRSANRGGDQTITVNGSVGGNTAGNVGGDNMIQRILGNFTGNTIKYNITSPYGSNKGRTHVHAGIDIGLITGTKLYAPWDGVVVRTVPVERGDAGIYLIFADTSKTYSVVYMHCSELLVTTNQQVKAGTVIALSGDTGHSTGPHLHLELHTGGDLKTGYYAHSADPSIALA